MLRCGFMDTGKSTLEVCVWGGGGGGNQECVNTPFSWCTCLLRLIINQWQLLVKQQPSQQLVFVSLLGSLVIQQQHYTFKSVGVLVEAYLKPVAFLATFLCFLIGLISHPAAALYI